MTTLGEIEQAIQNLSPEDLAVLRHWFAKYDAAQWDRQMEADAAAGQFDVLAEEALADFDNAQVTAL